MTLKLWLSQFVNIEELDFFNYVCPILPYPLLPICTWPTSPSLIFVLLNSNIPQFPIFGTLLFACFLWQYGQHAWIPNYEIDFKRVYSTQIASKHQSFCLIRRGFYFYHLQKSDSFFPTSTFLLRELRKLITGALESMNWEWQNKNPDTF